jgi:hypothetical protein
VILAFYGDFMRSFTGALCDFMGGVCWGHGDLMCFYDYCVRIVNWDIVGYVMKYN